MTKLAVFTTYLLLCSLISVAFATRGFDLSYFQGNVAQSAFSCLKNNGFDFGIIQATAGTGGYNPYCGSDIARAHAAGIHSVDVYIFPNTKLDPASSMSSLIDKLKSAGALTNNMIWMDIEGTKYWSGSCDNNKNWLQTAINTIESKYKGCGLSTCVGIYASESQWSPIMCNTSQFAHHQLWYAHYDNSPSFSDFRPFGGWSKPNIKQYKGTTGICGTSIDEDYYP